MPIHQSRVLWRKRTNREYLRMRGGAQGRTAPIEQNQRFANWWDTPHSAASIVSSGRCIAGRATDGVFYGFLIATSFPEASSAHLRNILLR